MDYDITPDEANEILGRLPDETPDDGYDLHVLTSQGRAVSQARVAGRLRIEVTGEDGTVRDVREIDNIITNYGDEYYAKMMAAGTRGGGVPAQPTLVARMKLGSGTTAPNKSAGTNEAMQTYLGVGVTASKAFDSGYPQTTDVGGNDTGWDVVYKTSWAAGEATHAAITEAVISSQTGDSGGVAGDTISRSVFSPVAKAAGETLAITWSHRFKGV